MTVRLSDIRVNSIVKLRGGFGSGPVIQVAVTGVHPIIKNGQPGVDYVTAEGASHWAYLDQIVSVVPAEGPMPVRHAVMIAMTILRRGDYGNAVATLQALLDQKGCGDLGDKGINNLCELCDAIISGRGK